jgi:DNA-3-methyladenine glycosylase I
MISQAQTRCLLPAGDTVYQDYHDLEWGVPVDSDRAFFEKVCLEGFQSGLSWRTILHRREAFRQAFAGFDMATVAAFSERDVRRLLLDARLIRNRRKILSAINNAGRAMELVQEFGSLAAFFWLHEPTHRQRPVRVTQQWLAANPQTPESAALADALKKRGWSFVGPVNMYALMQALGMVNDHVHDCARRAAVERLRSAYVRPVNVRP